MTDDHALDPLFDAFRQFGPQGLALADKYDLDNKLAQAITAGAMYDPGKWFATGEWGKRNLHSAYGESTAWYLSGGYRLARFTPYLTYAAVKANSNTSDPGLNVSALPPYFAGPATGLNAGLNELLGETAEQNTISVGSRWDVMKNVDLKLQYDHTRLGGRVAGCANQPSTRISGGRNRESLEYRDRFRMVRASIMTFCSIRHRRHSGAVLIIALIFWYAGLLKAPLMNFVAVY